MELVSAIFGPIILVLFLLVFFGMIAGVKADRVVSTYLNLVAQVFLIIGQILVKVAIPLLRQLGETIVYTTNHYLAEQKKKKTQISQDEPQNKANLNSATDEAVTQPAPDPPAQSKKEPTPSSANPYDDPPEPEIMD